MQQTTLQNMTLDALMALARELAVSGYKGLDKSALVAAILAHQPHPAVAANLSSPEPLGESSVPAQTTSAGVRLADLEGLPTRYGKTGITLLVQKPRHLYTYWEVTEADMQAARQRAGAGFRMVLRVYEEPGNRCMDIEVHASVGDWFFATALDWQSLKVDLGLITAQGEFLLLAQSASVRPAPSRPGTRVDPAWAVQENDFEAIYALSGGLTQGASSAQLQRVLREGWAPSSGGSPQR